MPRILSKIILSHPHIILKAGGERALARGGALWRINAGVRTWALHNSERFSADDWRDIQQRKLRRILRIAHGIPYWRQLFDRAHFDPWSKYPNQFDKIPISTRAALRDIPVDNRTSSRVPTYRRRNARTSGSTGEPFVLYRDAFDLISREVDVPFEYQFAGHELREPLVILGLTAHPWLERWGRRFTTAHLQDNTLRTTELYPYLTSVRPKCLRGTPTLIAMLSDMMERDGFVYRFDSIFFGAEHMSAPQRLQTEHAIGGRIFASYGLRECGRIALECDRGSLHVQLWRNFIEIVDESDMPVMPGVEGRIVLTNFENEVMPFIRYEIGDRGSLSSDACSCGRSTPVIHFAGRIQGAVRLASGKQVAALRVNSLLAKRFSGKIRQFQLEDSPERLVVRVVPRRGWTAKDARRLIREVTETLSREKRVDVRTMRIIPPNEQGKTPIFISGWH